MVSVAPDKAFVRNHRVFQVPWRLIHTHPPQFIVSVISLRNVPSRAADYQAYLTVHILVFCTLVRATEQQVGGGWATRYRSSHV